jgi:hypothetical protein
VFAQGALLQILIRRTAPCARLGPSKEIFHPGAKTGRRVTKVGIIIAASGAGVNIKDDACDFLSIRLHAQARRGSRIATRRVSGAAGWIRGLAARFSVAWFGFHGPPGIPAVPPAQAADWLGREYDALVFEARSDLHADALAIAAGLLRGGGVLLLIVAEADPGPFARRFVRFLAEPVVQWAQPGSVLPCPLPVRNEPRLRLNEGQRRAFRSMLPLPDMPDHASFVLTAPRGRGKSTLLGALVRHWRNAGVAGVRVTAPEPFCDQKPAAGIGPGFWCGLSSRC